MGVSTYGRIFTFLFHHLSYRTYLESRELVILLTAHTSDYQNASPCTAVLIVAALIIPDVASKLAYFCLFQEESVGGLF